MSHTIDVHKEFASFFKDEKLETLVYAVSKKLEEGHTCLNIENFNKDLAQMDSMESFLKTINIEAWRSFCGRFVIDCNFKNNRY